MFRNRQFAYAGNGWMRFFNGKSNITANKAKYNPHPGYANTYCGTPNAPCAYAPRKAKHNVSTNNRSSLSDNCLDVVDETIASLQPLVPWLARTV